MILFFEGLGILDHLFCFLDQVRKASLGSDLIFGFQQLLSTLMILFFEGLGILDHLFCFLDQVSRTVRVAEAKGG